jgi:hypothetical protein
MRVRDIRRKEVGPVFMLVLPAHVSAAERIGVRLRAPEGASATDNGLPPMRRLETSGCLGGKHRTLGSSGSEQLGTTSYAGQTVEALPDVTSSRQSRSRSTVEFRIL